MLLVQLAKAATPAYRKHIETKLAAVTRRMTQLEGRLSKDPTSSTLPHSFYYSSWIWSAIHILTGCRGFSKAETIAGQLKIPLAVVKSILHQLSQLGLVREDPEGWHIAVFDIHIDHKQFALVPYHQSWRGKAMERQVYQDPKDFFYLSVQSINPKDLPKLRAIVMDAIESFRSAVVDSSPEESLVVLNCDLFAL